MKEIEIYKFDEATEICKKHNFLLYNSFWYGKLNLEVYVSNIYIQSVDDYLEKKPSDIKRVLEYYPDISGYVVMLTYSLIKDSSRTLLKEDLLINDLEEYLGYKFEAPIYVLSEPKEDKPSLIRFLEKEEGRKNYKYYKTDYRGLFGNYVSPSSFYIIDKVYIRYVHEYFEENPKHLQFYKQDDFQEIKDKLVEVISYEVVHITSNGLLKSKYTCLLQEFKIPKIEELYRLLYSHRKKYWQTKSNGELEKLMLTTPMDCDYYDLRVRMVDSNCINQKNIAYKSKRYKGHIDINTALGGTHYGNPMQVRYIIVHSVTKIEKQVTFSELLEIADENSLIIKGTLAFNQYLAGKGLLAIANAFAIFRADKLKAESTS